MYDVREAVPGDLKDLSELLAALGFPIDSGLLANNLDALAAVGLSPFVACSEKAIGCITYSIMPVLHRPTSVGRISMLVVAQAARRQGVGRSLVEAAIARLRDRGCGLCEVTSNVALTRAHAFYESLDFERTSIRLVRHI